MEKVCKFCGKKGGLLSNRLKGGGGNFFHSECYKKTLITQQPEAKKGTFRTSTGDSMPKGWQAPETKKGIFRTAFKGSKNKQRKDTQTAEDYESYTPTRTYANDEERIINSDNPYEILGVSKNNTFEQISKTYKRLQKNYLQIDLHDKPTEERKRINTILIKINKAYSKIRSSHANSTFQNPYLEKKTQQHIIFHSEEDRILNSSDPFQILNVSPGATIDEIKRNYKKLQLKYKLTGMINKPEAEVLQLTNLLKKVNWAYTEIKKINSFS